MLSSPVHPGAAGPTPETTLQALATDLGLEAVGDRIVETAARLPLVSFSGWLASGKDTVAAAVYRALGIPVRHLSFAAAIKAELDAVICALRAAEDLDAATAGADLLGLTPEDLVTLAALLCEGRPLAEARGQLADLEATSRMPGVRRALQHLGVEIRRQQDPDYWIIQAQRAAVLELVQGHAFCFTDARLPDEVAGLQALGVQVVRLEISRATQLARLRGRDGIDPDPIALAHVTETALDAYPGFDLVCDNEAPLETVVAAVLAHCGRP
jgi:hypothetical protein